MGAAGGDFAARAGVALVVGASGGLGAAIARALLDRGSAVAATYRTAGSARIGELHRASAGLRSYQLDVTDAEACTRTVARVVADFGGLHTLVHAAGPHVPMKHLSSVTAAEFQDHLAAEAAAYFSVVVAALPHLRRSQGSIVAVTTAATTRFPVRDGLSAGPKGAVEATTRALAVEEGRYGVRANCVGPGMLTDGMAERLIGSGELDDRALSVARERIPLRRFGTAADIAEAVCFLASDRAGFITGQKLDVDGGYGA